MSPAFPDLPAALQAVRNLPPLPGVAAQVLASLGDERLDSERIAHQIASDTALAARTLRVANSPYYGLQGRIATIPEAVVVLGFANLRSLVMASALTLAFKEATPQFDRLHFWHHSLATAAAAGAAATVRGADPGLPFLAGLMHDMGRLALGVTFPAAFEAVTARRRRDDSSWIDAERQVLAFDHATLGAALCDHWRFPAAIGRAVAGHHGLRDGTAAGGLSDLVHVADTIARALDLAQGGDAAVPFVLAEAWERCAIDDAALQRILAETERQFRALLHVLG
jgi:putative nucleotidyltransferase with HDIG domain